MTFIWPFMSTLVNHGRVTSTLRLGILCIQSLRSLHVARHLLTDAIISELGQVAEGIDSRYSCGGKVELPSNKPIVMAYRQDLSKEWSSVEFPGVSEADMIKLLEACSVASYGCKGKDVVDKNYRNAFKLEPDNFITSFQMCATPILQEIQSIVPTVLGLKAELYKLNIYACGGFFKAHVDTPRSDKMFGSLVVCLPTRFTGGELIVRHHKQEIKYDWSSDTSSALHWAAFFSDVEHEILPVNEGYRVTLTYNLSYHSKESDSTFDVKSCSFYKLLQAALSNPVFMCDGGVLGFSSHYSYVFETKWADLLAPINAIENRADIIQQLGRNVPYDFVFLSRGEQEKVLRDAGIDNMHCKQILDSLSSKFPLLKGADFVVVETARSLGLPVCVKPFLSNNRGDTDFEYALKDFSQHMYEDQYDPAYLSGEYKVDALRLFGGAVCRYKAQDITWCQQLSYDQPAGAALHYGNEATVDLWYKSAAILIRIPKWSEHRQKLIAVSTGECCAVTEVRGTDRNGAIKDFDDVTQNYDDIIQEEIRGLNDQFKDLLDNKYIQEVEGLVEMLEEMQSEINNNGTHLIRDMKDDLKFLNDIIESDCDRVQRLGTRLKTLRFEYLDPFTGKLHY